MKYLIGLLTALLSWSGRGQDIPLGNWRIHPSFYTLEQVAQAGERLYAASGGGLFYYDRADNHLGLLSKLDGLAGVDVTDLRYSPAAGVLVVTYQSGEVDLLTDDGTLRNLGAIARANSIQGSRRINHVYVNGTLAYLSCDFGVVVVDLVRAEVRETYVLRDGSGLRLTAYSSAVDSRRRLVVVTNQGLQVGLLADNLLDNRSWLPLASPLPPGPAHVLAEYQERIYALANRVYALTDTGWVAVSDDLPYAAATDAQAARGQVLFATGTDAVLFNPAGGGATVRRPGPATRDALLTDDGALWTADQSRGLLRQSAAAAPAEVFTPEGPADRTTFAFYTYGDRTVLLHGGFGLSSSLESGRTSGFSVLERGRWTNYSSGRGTLPFYVADVVSAVRNPVNGYFYAASYGWGVVEITPDSTFTRWTDLNSTLRVAEQPGIGPGSPFVRIGGMAVDRNGDLWVANAFAPSRPLHVLRRDGSWEGFAVGGGVGPRGILDVLIDDNGNKWLRHWNLSSTSLGIVVYDDQQNRSRTLTTANGLPSNAVLDLVKDRDGLIWVATEAGVVVFYEPYAVFDGSPIAEAPRVRVNATQSAPLLDQVRINCLAVDGGNRKWIGTDNGLFLVSADGSEVIYHFTRRNSPLYSDRIVDVAVNGVSGEVFVSLEEGVISYRANATDAGATHAAVRVFPNPVLPDYAGQIAIEGLAADAQIKITDVAGRLVYETRAAGGTAVWNGRDYNGRRARSGVYLVFSASPDGTDGYVAKIAVVE